MKKITFKTHFLYFSFFFLLMGFNSSFSQVPFFEKSFGQTGVDIAFAVKQNPDSSVYLFGYASNTNTQAEDLALSKLSPNGDFLWTKYFGTPDVDFGLYMNLADSFDLILVGLTATLGPLEQEILVIKVDSAGQELWRKNYGGPGNQSCKFVEKTSDGMYILCGSTTDAWGTNDVYVLKLDANGDKVWDTAYTAVDNDYGMKIIESGPLNYVLSSDTRSIGNGGYDVQLLGLNNSGAMNFANVHGNSFQNGCQGVMQTSSGVNVVYGETEIATFSLFDFFFYMFDEMGGFLREKVFGGAGTDALFDVVETPNGDLMGCGYSNSFSNGVQPLNLAVVRTDSIGNLLFVKEFGGNGIDIGYSITPALGGGYYVAGRRTNADEDFYLLHIDESGLTSISENDYISDESMVMLPNPTHGQFSVKTSFLVKSWDLFDVTGQLLFHQDGDKKYFKTFDISMLSDGLYFLKANSEAGQKTSKVYKIN